MKFTRITLEDGLILAVHTMLYEDFTPEGLGETREALHYAAERDGEPFTICPEHQLLIGDGDPTPEPDFSGVWFLYSGEEQNAWSAFSTFHPSDDPADAERRITVLDAMSRFDFDHGQTFRHRIPKTHRSVHGLTPCVVQATVSSHPDWMPSAHGELCAHRFVLYAGACLLGNPVHA